MSLCQTLPQRTSPLMNPPHLWPISSQQRASLPTHTPSRSPWTNGGIGADIKGLVVGIVFLPEFLASLAWLGGLQWIRTSYPLMELTLDFEAHCRVHYRARCKPSARLKKKSYLDAGVGPGHLPPYLSSSPFPPSQRGGELSPWSQRDKKKLNEVCELFFKLRRRDAMPWHEGCKTSIRQKR